MAITTVTNTKDKGVGSLRRAIANASDGDTIVFSPELADKTIRLNKQLIVDKSLTIDGSDASNLTISGENKTRILLIPYKYSDVVLRDLTFANGRAVDNDPNKTMRGGAIELVDSNHLVVDNSRFIDNVGERSGAIFVGYGSQATVSNSVFDGNDGSVAKDDFSAGAISTYGGGEGAKVIKSKGDRKVGGDAFLEVRNTTFRNNKGKFGAVYTLLNKLTVEDSVFRNNEGLGGSGAIFTDGANGSAERDNLGGTTVIRNVVAENNVGGGDYGGAFFLSGYSKDKIIIEDSKIINNKAYRGGGIAVQSYRDEENPVQLSIRNSTIANNTSESQGGGLWTDVKGGVKIEDSTFSGNRVTNSQGNGQIGGAIALNTPKKAKSTISNTKFVDNYADVESGNIWTGGKTQGKNLTISNSQFADNRSGSGELENTVNFRVNDGGNNVVQNKNGIRNANTGNKPIAGAKLESDLHLDPVHSNDTMVDLRDVDFDRDGKVDEKVSLVLDKIDNPSSSSNSGGFYQVLDSDGSVIDPLTNKVIRPGETGYETAALKQRITKLEFDANDDGLTAQVDGGVFLAPYMIANGTAEEFIDKNPTNEKLEDGSGLNAYFAFSHANPDELQHLKSSDNSFGFEDSYGGGNKNFDFKDFTFHVSVASA